jgi:sterol desaturase/sphingolipid hydroxylase (fatty acid hydroxylase superfamily)
MKPDPSLLKIAIGFVILSGFFFILERLLGRGRGLPLFRKGWAVDTCFWFFTPLVTKWLTRLSLILPLAICIWFGGATMEAFKSGAYHGFGLLSRQPIWLQVIEIFLLADFISYWSHRLFHRRGWWPFHAVHHSSEDLDWLSSVRVHPVNDMVSKLCQATPILLLGFNPFVTLSTAPVFTIYAIFVHANVNWDLGPLRGLVATPVFHRWHHSKDREAWDKNFGSLFVFWDRIFGTYYMPTDRPPQNFGIPEAFPTHFFGQLLKPFAQWSRK